MGDTSISTAREALIAQLLDDIDGMVTRLEALDREMAARMQAAVTDAVGSASLQARLGFMAMIQDQEQRLTTAGRYAAAVIGNELAHGAVATMANVTAMERVAIRLAWRLGCVAFGSAALGGTLVVVVSRWL